MRSTMSARVIRSKMSPASARSGRRKPPPGRASQARRYALAYLYWLFREAPRPVSRAHLLALRGLLSAAAPLPSNPVRRACRAVHTLAPGAGRDPARIYRAFVAQLCGAADAYLTAMREGPEQLEESLALAPSTLQEIRRLLDRGQGLMISVPHNVGGILGSASMARRFPTLVLARNSTSEGRDRMMVDLFARLGVELHLTRSTNVAGLFRTCVKALRSGKVVVATLDNIDPGRQSRIEVPVFGGRLPMPTWGARIAARARAPLVPGWVTFDSGRFRIELGRPVEGAAPERLVEHYVGYFEQRILEDPASWLFLGHKRWVAALEAAAERRRAEQA